MGLHDTDHVPHAEKVYTVSCEVNNIEEHMDKEKRQQALKTKLADLEKRLAAVTKDVTKTLPSDFAEQATERENDDVLEEIARETQVSIQQLKAALRRFEDDSYGICATCGEPIAGERLDALPETTFCVDCAV
jgi:RNA polymerase-binding transcription factor DksA